METPSNVGIERKALAQGVYAPSWWDGSGLERDHFTGSRKMLHDAIEVTKAREDGRHLSWPNVKLELERSLVGVSSMSMFEEVVGEMRAVVDTRGRPTELELGVLRDMRQCRRVGRITTTLLESIESGDIRRVRESLDAAADVADGEQSQGIRSAYELMREAYERIVDPASQNGWAHYGLTNFDGHIGRGAPGSIFTVGARPNVGKSGLVLAMAEGAVPHGTRIGYVSLEDTSELVGPRLLALKSGISSRTMQRRRVAPFELPRLRDALVSGEAFPFYVDFAFGGDHVAVRHALRKFKRLGVNLVFIDYLQVLRYRSPANSRRRLDRREEIGMIMTELKIEAYNARQALVILSQLKRPDGKRIVKRGDNRNRPSMDELKEAGDIEEKSDLIALLWRDSKEDEAVVHCDFVKGKSGGVGYEFDLQRGKDGVLRELKPYTQEELFG